MIGYPMVKANKKQVKEMIVDRFIREVVPSGNSAHIVTSRKYVGDTAEVTIRKKYISCKRCHETFIDPKNFSPDPNYCKRCFNTLEFLKTKKKLKCRRCGREITPEEYKQAWDEEICPDCWITEVEKESEIQNKKRGGKDK